MPAGDHAIGLLVTSLSKTYHSANRPTFTDLNFGLPVDGRLAILGRNGQGKSTLIKMLGGVLPPSGGRIDWRMTSSWPIGFGGGFQGSLSGIDNIRFLSRLYERDYNEMLDRVESFAELGSSLKSQLSIILLVCVHVLRSGCLLLSNSIVILSMSWSRSEMRDFKKSVRRSYLSIVQIVRI